MFKPIRLSVPHRVVPLTLSCLLPHADLVGSARSTPNTLMADGTRKRCVSCVSLLSRLIPLHPTLQSRLRVIRHLMLHRRARKRILASLTTLASRAGMITPNLRPSRLQKSRAKRMRQSWPLGMDLSPATWRAEGKGVMEPRERPTLEGSDTFTAELPRTLYILVPLDPSSTTSLIFFEPGTPG